MTRKTRNAATAICLLVAVLATGALAGCGKSNNEARAGEKTAAKAED